MVFHANRGDSIAICLCNRVGPGQFGIDFTRTWFFVLYIYVSKERKGKEGNLSLFLSQYFLRRRREGQFVTVIQVSRERKARESFIVLIQVLSIQHFESKSL